MTGRFKTKYVLQGLLFSGALGLMGWSIASAAPPEVWGTPETDAASSSSKQATPSPPETAPEAAPAAAELDHNVYARASAVRREAALTDHDLAALGLDQNQAEAVLQRLVDWCETNGHQLDRAQQSLRSTERAVAELERNVRIGTATARDLQQLPEKRAEHHAAEASLDSIRGQVAAHALQGQLPSVVGAWEQARGHDLSVQGELRYLPALNDARLKTLRTTADQSGAALEDALMFDEKQQLQVVRQRVQDRFPGVVAAAEKVMPGPDRDILVVDE